MWPHLRSFRIWKSRTKNSSDFFDSLDLKTVIRRLLTHIHEVSHSENVIWILKDEFTRLKQSADQNKMPEPVQSLFQEVAIQAVRPLGDLQLMTILKTFTEFGSNTQIQKVDNVGYALVPIFMPQKKDICAYLLVANIPGSKPEKTMVNVSADVAQMSKHIEFSIQYYESESRNFVDALSGLYNSSYLNKVVENEIERSVRLNHKFTVLFIDVDYFKSLNDVNGHWIGSRVLSELGLKFLHNIRKSDYAFRYGGDEFVLVLPNTNPLEATQVAERLRAMVEQTDFIIDGVHLRLTLSIGLASFPDHAKSYSDIIKIADEAMYIGKNKSRNIVYVAS
jgi:diguanylate cyclase (GGDEF)-like protein